MAGYRQQVDKEMSELSNKLKKIEAELDRTKGKLRMSLMRESETNSKYEKLSKEHKICQKYMKDHELGSTTNPMFRASKKKKKRKSSKKKKGSKRR